MKLNLKIKERIESVLLKSISLPSGLAQSIEQKLRAKPDGFYSIPF
jgi:hypothetical protein